MCTHTLVNKNTTVQVKRSQVQSADVLAYKIPSLHVQVALLASATPSVAFARSLTWV